MADSVKKLCQNCKKDFVIEPEDFSFYEKIKVPPPTFCPECRLVRRMIFRNEKNLYHHECGLCKKRIISMFSKEKPFPVYCHTCWWGDSWDPIVQARPYDFSKPSFEQFLELYNKIPKLGLSNTNSTNSEYSNYSDSNKNCYLIFGSGFNENVCYGRAWESRDSFDVYTILNCELCYECINCSESYKLFFAYNCHSCTDSYFLTNCRNCQNCVGCSDLISKSYCIFNKQYSKEDYLKKIKEMNLGRFSNLKNKGKEAKQIYLETVHKYANVVASTGSSGDNIKNSKNCNYSFDVVGEVENTKYLYYGGFLKDSYDSTGQYKNELSYENLDSNVGNNNIGTISVYDSRECVYSQHCNNCSNLFFCSGLRSKQYCILNKQYTKEEYESLVPRIIQHMNDMPYVDAKGRTYKYGEFFPPELSPFCYNETIAQEYFPLTKEEAIKQGYKWKDREERNYQIDIKNEDIPDDTKDVDDSIINKVIECGNNPDACQRQGRSPDLTSGCTEAFKIIPDELSFYKRMNLPLPRYCPNCRHYNRLKQRNPLKLWHRKCMKPDCPNEFETSYAPERPEIVYCEQCYNREVY